MKCIKCGEENTVVGSVTVTKEAPLVKFGGLSFAGVAMKQSDMKESWEGQGETDEAGQTYRNVRCTSESCVANAEETGQNLRYYYGPERKGMALFDADGAEVVKETKPKAAPKGKTAVHIPANAGDMGAAAKGGKVGLAKKVVSAAGVGKVSATLGAKAATPPARKPLLPAKPAPAAAKPVLGKKPLLGKK